MTDGMNWDLEDDGKVLSVPEFDELCRNLIRLEDIYETQKSALSEVNKQVEKVRQKVLSFLDQYKKDKHFIDGKTLYMINRFTVTMPKDADKKQAFLDYLAQKGVFNDFVTVHSKTLNSFYKAELGAAQEEGNFDFRVPGLDEPKHSRSLGIRSK